MKCSHQGEKERGRLDMGLWFSENEGKIDGLMYEREMPVFGGGRNGVGYAIG